MLRCLPMVPLVPAALLGFVVGLRHATEADHVAAVSAIVARERTLRGAAMIGAAWGLGHTITLLLLGGTIVVFGLAVPRSVALSLELGVGAMLIGLGIWNVASRTRRPAHAHAPSPGALVFAHAIGTGTGPAPHDERPAGRAHAIGARPAPHDERPAASGSARRALRPLIVGSMHGLAGSAAAALVVVATVRSVPWGLAYLLVFGLGTTLGMTALTTVLALPLGSAMRRFRGAESWLRVGSGALSCAIGALVVYQIGFQDGLFLR